MKNAIGNKVLEVLLTCANLNVKQRFDRDMNKIMRKYAERSAVNARDKAIEFLNSAGKVNDRVIEETNKIVIAEYSRGLTVIKEDLKKKRTALYKHYKRKLPVMKAEWAKQLNLPAGQLKDEYKGEIAKELLKYNIDIQKAEMTLTYDLNRTDIRAIKYLTEADIFFIKDHAPDSPIAKAINEALIAGKERGLFGNDIAGKLSYDFGEYTPESFLSEFAQYSYWEGVVAGYDSITKTSAVINDFTEAGYITYRWYARQNERTCPICLALHNKVFTVESAKKDLDAYLKAAEDGNYEDLKTISPWLKSPEEAEALTEKDGYWPPAHPKCRCFVRMDLGYEYK